MLQCSFLCAIHFALIGEIVKMSIGSPTVLLTLANLMVSIVVFIAYLTKSIAS